MANLQAKLVSNQLMRAIMIAERLLTRLDARQIAEIVTGFFAILAESARAASPDSLTARP